MGVLFGAEDEEHGERLGRADGVKVVRRKMEERAGFEALPGVVVEELAGAGEDLDEGAAAVGVRREFLAGGEAEEGDASVVLAEERFAHGAFRRGGIDREREGGRGGAGARRERDVCHGRRIARRRRRGIDRDQGLGRFGGVKADRAERGGGGAKPHRGLGVGGWGGARGVWRYGYYD